MRPFGFSVAIAASLVCSACSHLATPARDMQRGKTYLAEKDSAHALVTFRRVLLATPRDPEAHYLAGLAHLGLGDYGSALTRISSAVELKPDFRDARMKLAELYASTRNPQFVQEAHRIARSLAGPESHDAPVLNLLALIEYQLGERANAFSHLRQAITQSPEYVRSYINLASLELAEERAGAAIEVLTKGRGASPRSAMLALALGRAYRSSGNTLNAERELQGALLLEPANCEALETLAALFDETGRRKQAVEAYRKLANSGNRNYRFAHGEYLLKASRFNDAESEFQTIYRRNSEDRQARVLLISALRGQNKVDAVRSIVATTLSRNPDDVEALLERGRIRLGDGQVDQAVTDLQRVITARVDSVEAHSLLAQAFMLKGRSKLYRDELAEVLRLNPALLAVRLQLVDSFIADKNADAALDTLRYAPVWQQHGLPVAIYRNSALLSNGNLPEVASLLPGQIARYAHPDLMLQEATLRLRMRQFTPARESISRAVKGGVDPCRALTLLAATYDQQGKPEEGLAVVSRAAANYPNQASVQFLLGLQFTRANRFEEARRAFTSSASDSSYAERANLALAALELKANRPAEARRLAAGVLRDRNPKSTQAVLLRAGAEAAAGEKPAAILSYRQVLESDRDNLEALNNLACLLGEEQAGREEALVYARRALRIQPGNAGVNDTLGWLLYRKGLRHSAFRYLQTAVAADGSARHKYHLSIAYAAAGDHRAAAHIFEQAYRQDPALDEAKLARSALSNTTGDN